MTTIYISSTFEDLKDYRSAVYNTLNRSGYRVIAMEDYVPKDDRPVDFCLRVVRDADIYVGIFGLRYGYIPPAAHANPDRAGAALPPSRRKPAQRAGQ